MGKEEDLQMEGRMIENASENLLWGLECRSAARMFVLHA